jgi:hypothetical protein
MTLNKTEIRILHEVLEGIDKTLKEISDSTCPECGTLECVVDYSWSYEMSIDDNDENRKIAMEMEKFILNKYYDPDVDVMIFEAGKESPVHKKQKLFFNSYHMFQYMLHRLAKEAK